MITAPQYPYPSKTYLPLNRCLYCDVAPGGSTEKLTDEHIIPYAFGGELILPKASCSIHQNATSKVEDFILRKYLCALRSHLSLPSRRPLGRPDGYKIKLWLGGHSWKKKVSLADHPGVVRFVLFADPPGRVLGREREQATWSVRFLDVEIFIDTKERIARLAADNFEDTVIMSACNWSLPLLSVESLPLSSEQAMDEVHVASPARSDQARFAYQDDCFGSIRPLP